MQKQGKIVLTVSLVAVLLLAAFAVFAAKPGIQSVAECKDGIDNDGDGAADWPADAGCSSRNDKDESNCGDGVCEGGETSLTCPADCGMPDSCSDSDGGVVTTVAGTTSGYLDNAPFSNSDYCVSDDVMEYSCNGAYETSQQISCGTDSYGADYCMNSSVYHDLTDYACGAGACGSSTYPVLVEVCSYGCTAGECDVQPASCSDSDGGFNELVRGTVSGNYEGGTPFSFMDHCLDNATLTEYVCLGGYSPYSSNWDCSSNSTGCYAGQCY